MNNQITVMGMVLQASPVGEYDKRIVLLTRERGKIAAFARGARKPNSTLVSCCQSFVFGTFTLYEGRNSYNVVCAQIENYFERLQEDWERVCYASYFMEVAEYLTRENVDGSDMLKLLYQSLRVLQKGEMSKKLMQYIFELKILCYDGEMPQMYECISCGREVEQEPVFFAKRGGICHGDHVGAVSGGEQGILLKTGTWRAMQYIVSAPVTKVYSFAVSPEVEQQLGQVAEEYVRYQINHEFKSLGMLC